MNQKAQRIDRIVKGILWIGVLGSFVAFPDPRLCIGFIAAHVVYYLIGSTYVHFMFMEKPGASRRLERINMHLLAAARSVFPRSEPLARSRNAEVTIDIGALDIGDIDDEDVFLL